MTELDIWNAIASLCYKRLVYFVKIWVTLSEKRVNLSVRCAIMLKACVVMSIQCLIMLKGYGVMLNSQVLSTRSLIMFKDYVIMLKIGLSCLRSM